jgi:hypothetical protein
VDKVEWWREKAKAALWGIQGFPKGNIIPRESEQTSIELSARKSLANCHNEGKHMTTDISVSLAGAPLKDLSLWVAPGEHRAGSTELVKRYRVLHRAFQRFEPDDETLSRPVLRGWYDYLF